MNPAFAPKSPLVAAIAETDAPAAGVPAAQQPRAPRPRKRLAYAAGFAVTTVLGYTVGGWLWPRTGARASG